MSSWLKQLCAGDEVIVDPAYGLPIQLHTVDRTTKKHILVGMWRFRREDGFRLGDGPRNRARLLDPTPDLRARIARVDAARFITARATLLERVPLATLNLVMASLKAMIP